VLIGAKGFVRGGYDARLAPALGEVVWELSTFSVKLVVEQGESALEPLPLPAVSSDVLQGAGPLSSLALLCCHKLHLIRTDPCHLMDAISQFANGCSRSATARALLRVRAWSAA